MRLLMTALLLSTSVLTSNGAWADNIAGCEVVLMEKVEQEGLEGSAEVASFRPAEDFIASIYDDETEVLREIDGLPIRAIMCKRQSVVPSLRDFPIVATGTPFMISQNFDSAETGLTTVYFRDGEFRSSYKGPELDAKTDAELIDRMEIFNLQPHDLAEKEKAMLDLKKKSAEETEEVTEDASESAAAVESEDDAEELSKKASELDSVASEDELLGATKTSSTEESDMKDDSETESAKEKEAAPKQKEITKEQHDSYK